MGLWPLPLNQPAGADVPQGLPQPCLVCPDLGRGLHFGCLWHRQPAGLGGKGQSCPRCHKHKAALGTASWRGSLMLPVWDPARAAMFCFMGWETAAHGMQTACYGAQGQDGLLGGTAGTGHAPKPAGGCSLGQRRLRPHVVIPRASPRLPPQTQHGAECWCELSAAANTFFAIFSPSAPCRWFQHYYFFNFPQ